VSSVTEQETYLDAVRRALADLDPATRDELLEDLPEHLAEVAAEGEGSLDDRLGPPEVYAAELRAAAGVAAPQPGRGLDDRVAATVRAARARLGAVDTRLGPVIGYGRLSEFLRLLRPAWWVLRGYLFAMAITAATTGTSFGLLPRLGGSTIAAVLMLAVCIPVSIWLGRRQAGFKPWPKRVVAIAGLLLLFFGLIGFLDAERNHGYSNETTVGVSVDPYRFIQDVYVYDENGRPMTNMLLFDQDGQPVRIGDPYRCKRSFEVATKLEPYQAYPYCPDQAPYQVGPRPGLSVAPTPAPTAPPTSTVTPTPVPEPTTAPTTTPQPTG